MDKDSIKKLMEETQNRWKNLESITQIKAEVEAVLNGEWAKNPFGCCWNDVDKVRGFNMDPDLEAAYNAAKVQFVKTVFLPTLERQIKKDKKRLGLFSNSFKALSNPKKEQSK